MGDQIVQHVNPSQDAVQNRPADRLVRGPLHDDRENRSETNGRSGDKASLFPRFGQSIPSFVFFFRSLGKILT
jgi:hypothetical protein